MPVPSILQLIILSPSLLLSVVLVETALTNPCVESTSLNSQSIRRKSVATVAFLHLIAVAIAKKLPTNRILRNTTSEAATSTVAVFAVVNVIVGRCAPSPTPITSTPATLKLIPTVAEDAAVIVSA